MKSLALVLLTAAALGVAGCGVGAGERTAASGAEMVITRDFGAERLGKKRFGEVAASDTVMRLLQREFDVETRFGGGFVQSIDGLKGGRRGSRRVDWLYYVNGIEAEEGAAARKVAGGDRIWWDHHDWGTAMRIPAVVGSYPEPFVSGVRGEHLPVRVDCAQEVDDICDEVVERLQRVGVRSVAKSNLGASAGIEILRLVVGPWAAARREVVAGMLEDGPGVSGVFARPAADGSRIDLLDERGAVAYTLREGGGLLAAVRYEDQQPTWFVTGTDEAGVAAAAASLDEELLANTFALAVENGQGIPLPYRPERP